MSAPILHAVRRLLSSPPTTNAISAPTRMAPPDWTAPRTGGVRWPAVSWTQRDMRAVCYGTS